MRSGYRSGQGFSGTGQQSEGLDISILSAESTGRGAVCCGGIC